MTTVASSPRPLRILVAEDDRVSQRLVVGLLEKFGHTAEVARNGSEAVTAASRARFDLAVMDLRMPVLDGLAATAAIRQHEASIPGRRLPIVMLTGTDRDLDQARCLDAGVDRCLVKPVEPTELVALLCWAGAPEASPAVDEETLAGYRAFDDGLLGTLIGEFLAEAPRRMRALRDAYAAGDVAVLKFEAHALKGSARVFGATPLADLCQALELTRVVDEDTRIHWDGLETEFRRVRAALETAREARES